MSWTYSQDGKIRRVYHYWGQFRHVSPWTAESGFSNNWYRNFCVDYCKFLHKQGCSHKNIYHIEPCKEVRSSGHYFCRKCLCMNHNHWFSWMKPASDKRCALKCRYRCFVNMLKDASFPIWCHLTVQTQAVMDNAAIHHVESSFTHCRSWSNSYLPPPYSPDIMPIDECLKPTCIC